MRCQPILTLAFIVLGIHTNVSFGARWAEASNGLTPGIAGARTVTVDHDGSTLYVVSVGGAIFKSSDGGFSWKALGGIAGALVLALDAASPANLYAGTLYGVRKSSDGGETWTSAGLAGKAVRVIAVDPVTPSIVFAAAGSQIYKSTDGAATWTALDLEGVPVSSYEFGAIVPDPVTPSIVYAIRYASPLYKSTDGGESWTVATSDRFTSLLAIAPSSPASLYGIRAGSGFSRSVDGGMTWSSISLAQSVVAVAVDPTDPKVLYATASGPNQTAQAIYKSTDAGQSWMVANTTLPPAISLAVNPVDPSVVYAASYKGALFKSTDAARTWSDSNAALRVFSLSVLAGDPANPAGVYAGGAEGLFKSLDGGATWNPFAAFQVAMGMPPPGVPLPSVPIPGAGPATVRSLLIDFSDPSIMYAGTRRADGCFFTDRNLYKSTDGGVTWTDGISPDRSGCLTDGTLVMDPGDSKTIYLPLGFLLDGYWLTKSTDGGVTWSYAGLSAGYFYSLVIDPRNSANLYVATEADVFRSSDGGATWNSTGLAQAGATLLAIDPLHPAVVYAAGRRGLVKSIDSGATWLPIGRGLADVLAGSISLNALIVDPSQSDTLFLATSGYGVFQSSDGGTNWAVFNDGLTNLDVQALLLLRGDAGTIFAGTSGGIFKLVNDGRQEEHPDRLSK